MAKPSKQQTVEVDYEARGVTIHPETMMLQLFYTKRAGGVAVQDLVHFFWRELPPYGEPAERARRIAEGLPPLPPPPEWSEQPANVKAAITTLLNFLDGELGRLLEAQE